MCPVECCLPDPNNQEQPQALLDRARKLHPDKDLPDSVDKLSNDLNRFTNPDHQNPE